MFNVSFLSLLEQNYQQHVHFYRISDQHIYHFAAPQRTRARPVSHEWATPVQSVGVASREGDDAPPIDLDSDHASGVKQA